MTDTFFTYTDQFVQFSEPEKELLERHLSIVQAPARTELVASGKSSQDLFFIRQGCVRKYYLKNGEEITIYIITENNFIGAFGSFITGTPSEETIETLEDCELYVLKKRNLDQLYTQIPRMNEFVRKVLETTLIQFQHALTSFILDSPKERYVKMLAQNPAILQRVPQHMLATLLGITPTSLSRIRKRILMKV